MIGIVSLFSSCLSDWMPLVIIPLSIWLRPAREDASDPMSKPRPDPTSRGVLMSGIAVVTGGNRGIGLAIAKRLRDAGHPVVVACRSG